MTIKSIETILYVEDQQKSSEFYEKLLRRKADLNVPGMTEFNFPENFKLGLMPNNGIAKIISPAMPHPDAGRGIPRCELYLTVVDVEAEFTHAQNCGAKIIDAPSDRNWGARVCYFADPDGHILALAQLVESQL